MSRRALRVEAQAANDLRKRRLDRLVPQLLEEQGIDCWLLIGREYAEGGVLASMLPAEWLSARRTTMLVLTKHQRMAVSRYRVGDLFDAAWNPDLTPDQWGRLVAILDDLEPESIAIGLSEHQAQADGLTATLRDRLVDELPQRHRSKLVSGGLLGIRWLETRLPDERALMEEATRTAHTILRRGLSTEAVTPRVTTTDDLVWWYRQTVHDAGLSSWFQPSVSIQRPETDVDEVIRPGDLLHVDFGIVHEGLCTDQQEHAYVLGDGEEEAPIGLANGLRLANVAQDLLMEGFVVGRTGNEILASALSATRAAGMHATIYTHSIGVHGHGAGMTIGMWDQQGGVRGAGDHQLFPDTAYSIELMVEAPVPEWGGQPVRFMVEQDAWFDGDAIDWLDGRQTELHLIGR